MAATPGRRSRSALALFLRANWKWLVVVIAATILVMFVASD